MSIVRHQKMHKRLARFYHRLLRGQIIRFELEIELGGQQRQSWLGAQVPRGGEPQVVCKKRHNNYYYLLRIHIKKKKDGEDSIK